MKLKQTRISKYRSLRNKIELDNMNAYKDFEVWWYYFSNQNEIKKELGCKH